VFFGRRNVAAENGCEKKKKSGKTVILSAEFARRSYGRGNIFATVERAGYVLSVETREHPCEKAQGCGTRLKIIQKQEPQA